MAKVTLPNQHGGTTEVELDPRREHRGLFQVAAEFISVVLSAVPMNYESQRMVLERAKDLICRWFRRIGEGVPLSNGDWEIAARMVAGICRYYMSAEECESKMDEVFREAQRIKAGFDAIASTADYFEWLEVAAAARGKKI